MNAPLRLARALMALALGATGLCLSGCGSTQSDDDPLDVGGSLVDGDTDGTTDEFDDEESFSSAGGTSSITISADENGGQITSFDPGAFVRITESSDDSAAQEGPPPGDGGAPPPPPPPGGDGGGAPPPGDGGNPPPPGDGGMPPGGDMPPPPGGDMPPPDGDMPPPHDGDVPPHDGDVPPHDGDAPPHDGVPPHDGPVPPHDGEGPPPGGQFPPHDGDVPHDVFPPHGPDGPPPPPGSDGFVDFIDCFNGNCPPPPRDFIENQHCEGDCGEFFGRDLKPEDDAFIGDFFDKCPGCPPLPPDFFEHREDGPPRPGDDMFFGERPPWLQDRPDQPPHVPDGFFFNNDLNDFVEGQGNVAGRPLDFHEVPFHEFFDNGGNLQGLFPEADLPPRFEHDQFGEFEFGRAVPEGFPNAPARDLKGPQDFAGILDIDRIFDNFGPGSPMFPPRVDDFGLEHINPELLRELEKGGDTDQQDIIRPMVEAELAIEEFGGMNRDYGDEASDMHGAIRGPIASQLFDDLPPGHPARELGEGLPPVEEFFPDIDQLEDNEDFEDEANERHQPLPDGFDGFDFEGSCPQYQDMFLTFNEETMGQEQSAQIHTSFGFTNEAGALYACSESTTLLYTQHPDTGLINDDLAPADAEGRWVSFHGGKTMARRVFECTNVADESDMFEAERTCIGVVSVRIQVEPQSDGTIGVGGTMNHTVVECSSDGPEVIAPAIIRNMEFGNVLQPAGGPTPPGTTDQPTGADNAL